MNKAELIIDYVTNGWRVEKEENWELVGENEVNGKSQKTYAVNVRTPERKFGKVRVVVVNEGLLNEEGKNIENAKPMGWETAVRPFIEDLRDFLDEKETALAKVFAISTISINEEDEVAEVMVYTNTTGGVSDDVYIVKRRNNLFEFKKQV